MRASNLTYDENNPTDSQRSSDDDDDELIARLKPISAATTSIGHNHRTTEANSPADDEEIGCLMDMLHLHMLQLLEEHISQQLTLKGHTDRARLLLARTRLQQGAWSTRPASFRLANYTPCRALCRLAAKAVSWGSSWQLLRFNVDPALGYFLPIKQIFGALVPHSLRVACTKWERCVEQIVECANLQRELQTIIRSIERLKWLLHRRHNNR